MSNNTQSNGGDLVTIVVTQMVTVTEGMDLGGGMVDYLFCLVGHCNGILTPLQCLVCLVERIQQQVT
jgi:hypothetical protein